jgi:RNA polymerase sigma-70 factor, ECF subfamily
MSASLSIAAVAMVGSPGIVAPMERDDDSALMQRYARGDLAAFTQLYERHKASLYRYLLRQTRRRETADDLFQEVWSRVIASRARYQPLAKFSTFLFSIAHNCFIDSCRRAGSAPTMHAEELDEHEDRLVDSDHRGPERAAHSEQIAERLRAALARLPDEQREAFLLHEEAGLSLDEIAELTAVGMETAKSRLRYAVAKLRRSLEAERDEAGADVALARAPVQTR